VETSEPSPLAHEVLGARPWAFLDDAPLEERRARAVTLRRSLPPAEAASLGALDSGAIAEVEAQVAPAPRDAEEAHDALLDLVLWPADQAAAAAPWLGSLEADGRARRLTVAGRTAWCAAEREAVAAEAAAGSAEAAVAVARGWAIHLGPFTAASLSARIGLGERTLAVALEALEGQGLVLRGAFLPGVPAPREAPHWCERGVLARIHRLTLGRLRREIEPVATADLMRFLTRWQHAAPGARLHGARGLAEVIGRLQGFHAAAGAWERDLLPARVAGYEPRLLDELCLHGEVAFGRLATGAVEAEAPRRRAAPTRHAPITLALRQDLPWLRRALSGPPPALGEGAAGLVRVLSGRGASFVSELVAATGRLPVEVEGALWELVSAGVVTCDAFAGLRALVDPPARGPARRPAHAGGRWSLLPGSAPDEGPGQGEALDRLARQYLRRCGVVFRDLLAREAGAPPWRDLLRLYRTAEARGEVRGGRFVAGFTGEQFALPEAVDALRAARRDASKGVRLELSAADPLNLVGILTPGARVAASLSGRVALLDGVPVEPGEGRAAGAPAARGAR
jgi:ATP-dependent Lhr-like helicase